VKTHVDDTVDLVRVGVLDPDALQRDVFRLGWLDSDPQPGRQVALLLADSRWDACLVYGQLDQDPAVAAAIAHTGRRDTPPLRRSARWEPGAYAVFTRHRLDCPGGGCDCDHAGDGTGWWAWGARSTTPHAVPVTPVWLPRPRWWRELPWVLLAWLGDHAGRVRSRWRPLDGG
jgi:hypothetical protein